MELGQLTIGLLHPGQMGAAIGATLSARDSIQVRWDPSGRGPATRKRAEECGLVAAESLQQLCSECAVILSVCPPHAAAEVAQTVATAGFSGIYVDANAIAPATATLVAETVTAAGATYVDGGIVGGPPHRAGTTRLYLSGPEADRIAQHFEGTALGTVVLPGALTSASALKAAYAAWTKGSAALLLAVRETARAAGVDDALVAEWARSQPALLDRYEAAERSAAGKGWRWVGEMVQIAATFEENGQPGGFHEAAAQVYRRYERPSD